MAIVMAVVGLLNCLTVLRTARHISPGPAYEAVFQMLVRPVVLSNVLGIVFCVCFFFALLGRVFKTSLCLVIVYTLLFVRVLFSSEYSDVADLLDAFFGGVTIFLLFQGVIGVRREKLKQRGEKSVPPSR
jgi:hypothetical protein